MAEAYRRAIPLLDGVGHTARVSEPEVVMDEAFWDERYRSSSTL